jgi:hypothetical protein
MISMFRLMYIITSCCWLIFSAVSLLSALGMASTIQVIYSGILLIACQIEEIYYLIEEKVIKHGRNKKSDIRTGRRA